MVQMMVNHWENLQYLLLILPVLEIFLKCFQVETNKYVCCALRNNVAEEDYYNVSGSDSSKL